MIHIHRQPAIGLVFLAAALPVLSAIPETQRTEGGQYRVLNAGSNGWATANQAIYLAKEGVRFKPDLVIVALYLGNDVSDKNIGSDDNFIEIVPDATELRCVIRLIRGNTRPSMVPSGK